MYAKMYRTLFAKNYDENNLFNNLQSLDTVLQNETEDKATYAAVIPLLLPDLIGRAEAFLYEKDTYIKAVGLRMFHYLVEPLDIISSEGINFLDDALIFAMVLLRLEEAGSINLNSNTRSKCLFVTGICDNLNPFIKRELDTTVSDIVR